MGRQGARVARRKHKTGRVGFSHRVKREETMVRSSLSLFPSISRIDEEEFSMIIGLVQDPLRWYPPRSQGLNFFLLPFFSLRGSLTQKILKPWVSDVMEF